MNHGCGFFRFAVTVSLILVSSFVAADVEKNPVTKPETFAERRGFFVEYFTYQDYVYSRSRKTELGDQVNLYMASRYQYDVDTFARLLFATDPVEDRFDNKTSKFELLVGRNFDRLYFQVDVELNTNDGTGGATSIGLDLDSKLTVISYRFENEMAFKFYPFNFGGDVGREFNSWDVTRLFFIEGAPSTINNTQLADEKVGQKTIPGVELGFSTTVTGMPAYFYSGIGAASFLHPANGNFDVETSPNADRWERKEDIGYKAGARINGADFRLDAAYVSHTQSRDTGSLLEAAASIYNISRVAGHLILENEIAYSKAGKRPYRLARGGEWFEETTPFQPIYSDYYGVHQNWLGKADVAYSLRAGWEMGSVVPYLTYKYQGGNFVFRDRESAHLLRTADEALSHGGLNRYGVGTMFYIGDFALNPEFEWLQAKNPVFGNSSDVRQDRVLSSFHKEDYSLFLTVSYKFGGNNVFRP